jgi:adenine-specific DNA-methyltransferase
MQKTNIPQAESKSADLVAQNLEYLKQIFPEVIKEGRVDFEALNDLLGNYADTAEERFCLNWAGKANARREAQKRSTGTLRPCPEESVDWDSTENLYIEGDNLEVLKLLQKSYHSRVKMIYIDPPYNTGKDFVYKDNYTDNIANYLEQTGQDKKLSTNTESDGRYHSNWLNMMYPRLKLARNLLTDDGVIFISIDDNEVANLRKICDEIFGEGNFINEITVNMNSLSGVKMTHAIKGKRYPAQKEYILLYKKSTEQPTLYIEKKEKGGWDKEYNMIIPELKKEEYDQFQNLTDEEVNKTLSRMQLVSLTNYAKETDCDLSEKWKFENAYRIFGTKSNISLANKVRNRSYTQQIICYTNNDGNKRFFRSDFNKETKDPRIELVQAESNLTVFISDNWIDISNDGGIAQEGGVIYPNGKKPLDLIKRVIKAGNDKNGIYIDFFSGSSTAAHAVMQLNMEDGGTRKFIMVQYPEDLDFNLKHATGDEKEDIMHLIGFLEDLNLPHFISEIGKERIRRAGKKILEEQKAKAEKEGGLFAQEEPKKLDTGFKVFKLDSSNINAWDSDPDNLETALSNSLFNIKTDRSEDDLLYEIVIKYGIELTEKINRHSIDGKTVYEIGAGSLIVCLADSLSTAVAEGIGKLYKEVSPEGVAGNGRVVFKEAGFNGSDEVKTNTLLILKQHGITNVATV